MKPISAEQAIAIARAFVQRNGFDCVLDAPTVSRLPEAMHPHAWEVMFRWTPTPGLWRSSRGCGVVVDRKTGAVVPPEELWDHP